MLFIAIALFLISILLFWTARHQRTSIGLPGGRIIYEDTHTWHKTSESLYDPIIGLTGKPDYLIEKGKSIIPIEIKSTQIPSAPYDSHIMQLAAYCLLVERVTGKRPPYGILHYQASENEKRTFALDFTPQLEHAILDVLVDMQSLERKKDVDRSHEIAARCHSCGYKYTCDRSLSYPA
jgi:CRISPR-associated exonuclease Cas4